MSDKPSEEAIDMHLLQKAIEFLTGSQGRLERAKDELEAALHENRRSADALRSMTEQMRRTENQDRFDQDRDDDAYKGI